MVSADRVAAAAHSYVSRALAVVRESCPAVDDRPFEMGFTRWVEEGEVPNFRVITRWAREGDANARMFVLVPDIWSAAKVCAGRVLGDLRLAGMPEFEVFADALRNDPIIGPRLGADIVAGAGLAGGPLQIESLVDALALELLDGSETELTPRPEAVQQAIERSLRYLRRPNDEVAVLSPLSLMSLDDRQVDLPSRTKLSAMTGDEIAAAGKWRPFRQPPSADGI